MNARPLVAALAALCLLSGCHRATTPAVTTSPAEKQAALDSQRQQLELVPPPSKTRYMAIRSLDTWENPYLTVQPDMVTLHVLLADANPTSIGVGGMTRPLGARRQDINLALDKLGEGLAAVPRSSWPYGRVIAVEEAHKIPAAGRPQVRREMEATMKTLTDLGVVIYEWNETGPRPTLNHALYRFLFCAAAFAPAGGT